MVVWGATFCVDERDWISFMGVWVGVGGSK